MKMIKKGASATSPEAQAMRALKPFVDAFDKIDHPGMSDLYNEQPVSISVTLGDIRRARAVLRGVA